MIDLCITKIMPTTLPLSVASRYSVASFINFYEKFHSLTTIRTPKSQFISKQSCEHCQGNILYVSDMLVFSLVRMRLQNTAFIMSHTSNKSLEHFHLTIEYIIVVLGEIGAKMCQLIFAD